MIRQSFELRTDKDILQTSLEQVDAEDAVPVEVWVCGLADVE